MPLIYRVWDFFLAWKNITDHSTRERERQKRACCRVSRATDWCITAPQMEWGRVRKRNTSMLCGIWLLVKMIAAQKSRELWRSITAPQRGWGLGRKRKTDMWNMILSFYHHQAVSQSSAQEAVTVPISHPVFDGPVHALYCNRQTTQPTLRAIVVQISPLVPKALVCFYPRGRVMFWQLRLVSDHIKTPVNGDSKSTPVLSLSFSLRLHWENRKQGRSPVPKVSLGEA